MSAEASRNGIWTANFSSFFLHNIYVVSFLAAYTHSSALQASHLYHTVLVVYRFFCAVFFRLFLPFRTATSHYSIACLRLHHRILYISPKFVVWIPLVVVKLVTTAHVLIHVSLTQVRGVVTMLKISHRPFPTPLVSLFQSLVLCGIVVGCEELMGKPESDFSLQCLLCRQ